MTLYIVGGWDLEGSAVTSVKLHLHVVQDQRELLTEYPQIEAFEVFIRYFCSGSAFTFNIP